MKLVVGIGNPGERYVGTRHNVGYEVVERLALRHGFGLARDKRLNARIARGWIGSSDVMLLEPLSYVNLSGPVVARVVRERDIALEDLLVVVDDFHLDLAVLRLRKQGSAGGHNGLKSLIGQFGQEFSRLRIGIGHAPEGGSTDFVLKRFKPVEREPMDEAYDRGANCIEDWMALGADAAITKHNG